MRADQVKAALRATVKPGKAQSITPFIIGKPGVGKSHVVAQVAKELGLDFVDLRLSQVDNTDLKGIPAVDKESNTSKWYSPEFLPTVGNKRFKDSKGGILFLDEFNRAAPDVVQSAFQLVYDYAVGDAKILPNWYIVAAGNMGLEDGCDVNEFDAAMNDRICYIKFDANIKEWIKWAKQNDISEEVISFIKSDSKYFYYDIDKDKNQAITPRRWAQFSNVLKDNKDEMSSKELTLLLGSSMIGPAAPMFIQHIESLENINGEMILKNYGDVAEKLKSFELSRLAQLSDNMVETLKTRQKSKKKVKITSKELDNMKEFMSSHLTDDHMLGFWSRVATEATVIGEMFGERFPELDDELCSIIKKSFSDGSSEKK